MTNKKIGQVDACYDNSEDGKPNYCIDLVPEGDEKDGIRLYSRGAILNPKPKKGDFIEFLIINTKKSKQDNLYSNVHSVKIIDEKPKTVDQEISNEIKKNKIVDQNMIMFVTGLSGRSMQSGRFPFSDIPEIVKVSARSYVDIIVNENY